MANTLTLTVVQLLALLVMVGALAHTAGYLLGHHHADERRRARLARRRAGGIR